VIIDRDEAPITPRAPNKALQPTPHSGAAELERCYDFRCQEGAADFLRSSCFFCPQCIGKAGARKRRRVLLLLSVGWLPPYVHPSGAGLCLGSSVLYQPLNAAEGYTTPGLRLFRCTLAHLLR
jgi:hypothetical protein